MEKHTPLYAYHLAAGGRMVPFAGYLLPVQYTAGVIAEHMAVREQAGLFDVSHMGEILLQGQDALANLNRLLTNDFTTLSPGRARYSLMCNHQGGVVDDLLVYNMGANRYLLVVNAANRDKDAAWLRQQVSGNLELSDISDHVAQIALQGPRSAEIAARLLRAEDMPDKYYSFRDSVLAGDVPCLVSRTGYTGEPGYEFYLSNQDAPRLWELLLAAGRESGLIPCGLGARDTLRLEAGMPLYGHEMDESVTPYETGLDFVVKPEKDFIGRDAILALGRPRERVGLKMVGRGIAREHQDVYCQGQLIGHTTSGTHCPYLGAAYAMALIAAGSAKEGDRLEVDVRGRMVAAELAPLPFYKRLPI